MGHSIMINILVCKILLFARSSAKALLPSRTLRRRHRPGALGQHRGSLTCQRGRFEGRHRGRARSHRGWAGVGWALLACGSLACQRGRSGGRHRGRARSDKGWAGVGLALPACGGWLASIEQPRLRRGQEAGEFGQGEGQFFAGWRHQCDAHSPGRPCALGQELAAADHRHPVGPR